MSLEEHVFFAVKVLHEGNRVSKVEIEDGWIPIPLRSAKISHALGS